MNQQKVIEIFQKVDGYLQGHFELTSGKHSKGYMQCAKVLQYPANAVAFGDAIADMYRDCKIDCVVGPAMGGIIIAHEVSRALDARCVFTERVDGDMRLRRGFAVEEGEKILVVEDVITTGISIAEVIKLLKEKGADVVGGASIVDRSATPVDIGAPYKSLAKLEIEVFEPEDCPLCKDGVVMDKPGSRKK